MAKKTPNDDQIRDKTLHWLEEIIALFPKLLETIVFASWAIVWLPKEECDTRLQKTLPSSAFLFVCALAAASTARCLCAITDDQILTNVTGEVQAWSLQATLWALLIVLPIALLFSVCYSWMHGDQTGHASRIGQVAISTFLLYWAIGEVMTVASEWFLSTHADSLFPDNTSDMSFAYLKPYYLPGIRWIVNVGLLLFEIILMWVTITVFGLALLLPALIVIRRSQIDHAAGWQRTAISGLTAFSASTILAVSLIAYAEHVFLRAIPVTVAELKLHHGDEIEMPVGLTVPVLRCRIVIRNNSHGPISIDRNKFLNVEMLFNDGSARFAAPFRDPSKDAARMEVVTTPLFLNVGEEAEQVILMPLDAELYSALSDGIIPSTAKVRMRFGLSMVGERNGQFQSGFVHAVFVHESNPLPPQVPEFNVGSIPILPHQRVELYEIDGHDSRSPPPSTPSPTIASSSGSGNKYGRIFSSVFGPMPRTR